MAYLGRCILCGASLMVLDRDDHREGGICETCGINARLRGVVLAAVRELCGYPNAPLRALEPRKNLRVLGISDHEKCASELERVFDYTNTYFHKNPHLDICDLEALAAFQDYDMVICSDVIEHTIKSPAHTVPNLVSMLRPGGALVLSTPTFQIPSSIEWYGGLREFSVERVEEAFQVHWLDIRGQTNIDRKPIFHGGAGTTLEMRVIAHEKLVNIARGSGTFFEVIEFIPEWGYSWQRHRERAYLEGEADGRIMVIRKQSGRSNAAAGHPGGYRAPVADFGAGLPAAAQPVAPLVAEVANGLRGNPMSVQPRRGQVRARIIDTLWRGQDPFLNFPVRDYTLDTQGWNSDHPYLVEAMTAIRPLVVVEVGVWKGGSTITMARRLRALGLDGVVIAVDTWLGSAEHWANDDWFGQLHMAHGYPRLAYQATANVLMLGLEDFVVPLPLDSRSAMHVLRHFGIRPEVVHIDGGHDYDMVMADLRAWWGHLKPGGLLIGDDYGPDGAWQDVRRAFDDFFGPLGLTPLEHHADKCRIRKPVQPE